MKKKMKRMNMGGMQPMNGMGSRVREMAQAPNRTGGIGQQVSQMARAQNNPPVAMPTLEPGKPVMPQPAGAMMAPAVMPTSKIAAPVKTPEGMMPPAPGKLTGIQNAMARRQRNLDRFSTKKAGDSKFADIVARRKASIDSMKARVPTKTMKAGGLVKANGCAQRGKTRGKMR